MVCNVVMAFDVVKIDRIGDAGLMLKIHQVSLQVRIINNAPQVALEVAMINGIKTHKRAK